MSFPNAMNPGMSERETMPVDVVIVGRGPAGLSAAIRLKQFSEELIVLENGGEIGAQIFSGAVTPEGGGGRKYPNM